MLFSLTFFSDGKLTISVLQRRGVLVELDSSRSGQLTIALMSDPQGFVRGGFNSASYEKFLVRPDECSFP